MSEPDELQQKLQELRATLAEKRAARKAQGESDFRPTTAASPLEQARARVILDQLSSIDHARSLSQQFEEPPQPAGAQTPIEPLAALEPLAPAPEPVVAAPPPPAPIDPYAPSAPDADELAAFQAALSSPMPLEQPKA